MSRPTFPQASLDSWKVAVEEDCDRHDLAAKFRSFELTPFGNFPNDGLRERLDFIQRPYVVVSKEDYDKLEGNPAYCDVFKDAEGNLYTFGNPDSGYALMPVKPGMEEWIEPVASEQAAVTMFPPEDSQPEQGSTLSA